MVRKVPRTFMEYVFSQSSRSSSQIFGCEASFVIPALAQRMWIGPERATASRMEAEMEGSEEMSPWIWKILEFGSCFVGAGLRS